MTPKEKEILEANVTTALNEVVGSVALIKAHEVSLMETLQELKRNRHKSKLAAKHAASQSSPKGGDAATGASLNDRAPQSHVPEAGTSQLAAVYIQIEHPFGRAGGATRVWIHPHHDQRSHPKKSSSKQKTTNSNS
jgi:hypothetical protein